MSICSKCFREELQDKIYSEGDDNEEESFNKTRMRKKLSQDS